MQTEMSSNTSSPPTPPRFHECIVPETQFIVLGLLIISIITTPLSVFVLVLGYQKWKKQRLSSSFLTLSHIDVFTYNVVVLDFISLLGNCLYYFGTTTEQEHVRVMGMCMFVLYTPGQILFHLVTCVERYLAVVHPVVYLHLRGSCGVWIRNVTIGGVWFLSCGVLVLVMLFNDASAIVSTLLLFITSVVFGFCSLSVLCALIRPGPGDGGGARERNQSKQRAFITMMVITGAHSLRFFTTLIVSIIQNTEEPLTYVYCLIGWSSEWFLVPSSLVLPLLFLQREGKLPGCGPRLDESA